MDNQLWKLKTPPPKAISDALRKAAKGPIDPFIIDLLVARGIDTPEKASQFFSPKIEDLHDPYLMKDMQNAVDRILKAIREQEAVLIYGDYDVDGTSAVSMMYQFLKNFIQNIHYYIPDRFIEGYGISIQGIEFAKCNNCTLIISLDCGIKAADRVHYAQTLGIDFIICDHHEPGDELPDCTAVLDPKRKDCGYPFKELCGCGVGYKLICALSDTLQLPKENKVQWLDYVVLAIGADIVSLMGENRVLAYHGLKKIINNPWPGIEALMQVSGLKDQVSISRLVFVLAPRINAAGRLFHASSAVQLLTSTTKEEAEHYALQLHQYNLNRKDIDSNITQEALEMIRAQVDAETRYTTVLFNPDWNKGVVGIVASRCIEHYYRPTVILTENNGKAAGSARSIADFDLYNVLSKCTHVLDQFGGHKHAAGMTLSIDKIADFREIFELEAAKVITPDMRMPRIDIDLILDLSKVTLENISLLQKMEPFGPDNMTPVFIFSGVTVKGTPLVMKEKHIRFSVQQKVDGKFYEAQVVGFGMAQIRDIFKETDQFDIVATLDINSYNGYSQPQLLLRAIRPHSNPV